MFHMKVRALVLNWFVTGIGVITFLYSIEDIAITPNSKLTVSCDGTTSTHTEIVQIRVTDDDVYEESQQVVVGIMAVEPSSVALIGDHHSNTFTVLDNNGRY